MYIYHNTQDDTATRIRVWNAVNAENAMEVTKIYWTHYVTALQYERENDQERCKDAGIR